MKNIIIFLFIFINVLIYSNTSIDINISQTNLKIGDKFTVTFNLPVQEKYSVLKEIQKVTAPLEIVSSTYVQSNDTIQCTYICAIFEDGTFDNLFFTIPVSLSSGTVIEYETKKFTIIIESVLTEDEKTAFSKIKEPEKIELKNNKDIYKFRFYFENILLLIFIVILIVFIILIVYKFIIKRLIKSKKNKDSSNAISSFEKFISDLEKIRLETEDRKEYEMKISVLSETFKEFIYRLLAFNAVSETTRELISSLRESQVENELIYKTSTILNKLDMIKFAKASVTKEQFYEYIDSIKDIGVNINNFVKLKNERENELNTIR
ncbi:MAG: hypothetical protein A2015_06950 [Spirochaetes bacterium GWF1_31_7]|nr:MAG: hypothetical protein A2Y30_09510 [Spirochaetes bacterium GWE1_32_154]OHD46567.1 MAG: hypothetical protein A2015_06950 [Spirochaetes bacterium GWF1_31_7]OHD49376.1 MAG: hypothetical protein A2Y29_03945 [Spirochaetes bacterium GWE2_31_10]OHD79053.1 MAG: hypothetical protein A2355_15565 [Spirochaetes bacterium RIFOXYB1_FULL_32_8]HBD93118.1 hypothetical protein [Spirochaetia bacterium]